MVQTIGYHVVKSGYGQWLRGDDRGSWSQAWDEQIGYIEPHTLHAGDPVRMRMAQERMNHPAVQFSDAMLQAIADALGRCVVQSNGGLSIAAATIEATHMHLLILYSGRDIHKTVKWLARPNHQGGSSPHRPRGSCVVQWQMVFVCVRRIAVAQHDLIYRRPSHDSRQNCAVIRLHHVKPPPVAAGIFPSTSVTPPSETEVPIAFF